MNINFNKDKHQFQNSPQSSRIHFVKNHLSASRAAVAAYSVGHLPVWYSKSKGALRLSQPVCLNQETDNEDNNDARILIETEQLLEQWKQETACKDF